jgi:hypothetical protein
MRDESNWERLGGRRPVLVWLWDAGSTHGVTDDGSWAREAASASMRSSGANTGRVESAILVTGTLTLTTEYRRTGSGWLAQRDRGGRTRWEPLLAAGNLHR